MIVVSATMMIDEPDRERASTLMREVAEATRREPGCSAYAISADLDVPGKFRVLEEWESREPLRAHLSTPHIQRFMAAMAEIRVLEMSVIQYEVTRRKQAM